MKFKLKEALLLGTATAATQIEGGDENNNWARFAAEGKVKDGTTPARADDHYVRFKEDIDLMEEMGLQIYRFGIEWSRIEPQRGMYSEEAIAHYREEIEYMISKGILPLLTLHHFTNPLWFEDMGAFEHKDSPEIFLSFVKKVIESFGDLVSEYITINEPNVYCTNSLLFGEWPPEKKSFISVVRAFSNLTAAHILAYDYIHEKRRKMGFDDTKVSFANHLRIFEPENAKNPLHHFFARATEYLFQEAITTAMMTGKCCFPVLRRKGVKKGKYYDFIGINYYSRSTVKGFADGVRAECYKNDLGWEIYHEGLLQLADSLFEKYRAPIYVTENGTCDNNDSFRSRFIYDQLKLISECENHISRYYHWSFTDNFEWKEGESARFGIVHVDYETQKRMVKQSGKLYASIIKNGGVTDEAFDKFVKDSRYNKKLTERFEFRNIHADEIEQAVTIEQICFPPNEACSEKAMKERIKKAPELFLVAVDKETGKIAGFLNGLSTNEQSFRDEFFTDANLYDPNGKNVMLLGLDVLPEYRMQGLAREIVRQYIIREREHHRERLILTCLQSKVEMYKKMGFRDDGIANSSWGGEEWHEMSCDIEGI